MKLKDNGQRREFESGAVRDICEGKGRCDLLPLYIIGRIYRDYILQKIGGYIYTGNKSLIEEVIRDFIKVWQPHFATGIIEVAKHYEDGAAKYEDRNWEKGIPMHCYIDSGVRHYLKFLRGDTDEPHDRAFIWNMLGLLWTAENIPEMNDLPFKKLRKEE